MPTKTNDPTRRGMKAWHLVSAVVATALILRVGLGALPTPSPQFTDHNADPADKAAATNEPPADPVKTNPIEVLPFDLHGEVPGPLLTAILQRYLPHSTPDHADTLRDTLPPGEDPRMIVIIPEQEDAGMF